MSKNINLSLTESFPEIQNIINQEKSRQNNRLELIASENFTSKAVMDAQGSVLTNKYAEGYPGKRYYGGCEYVDKIEQLAIDNAKKIFGCEYANVQPHSGTQANQAVFYALIKPGDTILGQSLDMGGHLTHGSKANFSGKWFNAVSYGLKKEDNLMDYDEVRALAHEHKPKLIIAGFSAYPRTLDWSIFREIADEVGAYLLVDMSHVSGLIVTGDYPSPIPHAHIVTSTTHKTLRGPRSGLILTNDVKLAKKVNSAIFPGVQAGPLVHVVAGKAVAFAEAATDEFKQYIKQVIANARILAKTLMANGIKLITDGTDNHMVLLDFSDSAEISGKDIEEALERAGIACNKNTVPNDPKSAFVTSGIRLGTPACTTRGFKEPEFEQIANLVCQIVQAVFDTNGKGDSAVEAKVLKEVESLCQAFPLYN